MATVHTLASLSYVEGGLCLLTCGMSTQETAVSSRRGPTYDLVMASSETERRWLDYAWAVVNCPESHRRECVLAGGAVPGPGRPDGNDLRWPGYLGRNYDERRGVLCVGAVHRESSPERLASHPIVARTDANLIAGTRAWLSSRRPPGADEEYLEVVRRNYEEALPQWGRWRRHFRELIERHLHMDLTQIAWANLAKCRVSIDLGSKQRKAEGCLQRLCQGTFPIAELVEAIRPVVVLVASLNARSGGEIVDAWKSPSCAPLVYAWQGQSGHDRHNTDPQARPLRQWAPEMAQKARSRFDSTG